MSSQTSPDTLDEAAQALDIHPIEDKCFGAVISNISLRDLDEPAFKALYAALLEYGFLVFPGQHLNDEENIAFGERFGPLEFGAAPLANQKKQEDGTWSEVYDLHSQRMRTNVGNEAWHTDSTYWPVSSKCAMLSAVTVTERDGETELADMRAAYDALDEATQRKITTLSAYHSTEFSQANDLGDFPVRKEGTIYHGEAFLRPLVKTHPDTGRKSLFIGRHAFGIPGLSRQQSRALLQELVEFTVSEPTRVYSHKWQAGDLLLWDNRCLLHRARPYDYSKPRVLIGTRVAGDPVSELSYTPDDPRAAAGREALNRELEILREEAQGKMFGDKPESGQIFSV